MAINSRPLVTIGIPTFNRADGYLREALQSAMLQTYPAVEIIISDNCSTDHTEAFATGLADDRVRYFRQTSNIDANDNFNFCLNKAEGEYFLLLHDDDCIDHDFIEVCMTSAEDHAGSGIIRTGVRTIDAEGRTLREYPNQEGGLSALEFVRKWLSDHSMLILCSTLFNTAHLKAMGGFDSRHNLFQDVAAEIQLATRFGRLDVKDVKASFRKHGEQRTNASRIREWGEDSIDLLNTICNLFPDEKDSLRSIGNIHFSKHNYDLATGIPSLITRYSTYAAIYRMFDYEFAPFRFFYERAHNRVFTHLGQIKRKLLGIEVAGRSSG